MEYVRHDTVRVWKTPTGGRSPADLMAVLYWGDGLEVLERTPAATRVKLSREREGWVRGELRTAEVSLLAFAFIDVGQGDACLVTTPGGKRILVDGGENKLAARYLAARFQDEMVECGSVHFDAIVVTHGDADHFDGLSTLILDAEQETRAGKRIRVTADRVFHNGLVKRGASLPDRERLGPSIELDDGRYVEVVDDPRTVSDANRPFQRWQRALTELAMRVPLKVSRLDDGMDSAFDFLDDVQVTVLGPRAVPLDDVRRGLPLLSGSGGTVSSRTINGHSVVLRFSYGNVSVLLTGDVHGDAQRHLLDRGAALKTDVLKVPHHGSDDVHRPFIDAVAPLVSIISAGDEDARRDYLHPRASLLAMLGQASRGAEPVVFITNLAAFDRWSGEAFYAVKDKGDWKPDVSRVVFYARERTAYGIIHVRTDGERLLVVRRGARPDRYEAYAYMISEERRVTSSPLDAI